jgi:hypothetical protein
MRRQAGSRVPLLTAALACAELDTVAGDDDCIASA